MGEELEFRTFLVDRWVRDVHKGQEVCILCGSESGDCHSPASALGGSKKASRSRSRNGHIFPGKQTSLDHWCSFVLSFSSRERKEVQVGSVTLSSPLVL